MTLLLGYLCNVNLYRLMLNEKTTKILFSNTHRKRYSKFVGYVNCIFVIDMDNCKHLFEINNNKSYLPKYRSLARKNNFYRPYIIPFI